MLLERLSLTDRVRYLNGMGLPESMSMTERRALNEGWIPGGDGTPMYEDVDHDFGDPKITLENNRQEELYARALDLARGVGVPVVAEAVGVAVDPRELLIDAEVDELMRMPAQERANAGV